jgi:RimJ/RimL family protein N-acetyltransferase
MGKFVAMPVVLQGASLRLEPLSEEHLAPLCAVGLDDELWRWSPSPVRTTEEMAAYVSVALKEQANGRALPFAVVEKSSERVIGSTRFGNIEPAHRRVEIGWTWYGRPWHRTRTNTEAKYLLLQHAFETLSCIRVELKTDSLNQRSRAAIQRLGASEEGCLRNHMITVSGRIRHTICYSIVDSDWTEVKATLERRLSI